MKLGRNDLQHKPDGWIRPFFGSAARGSSYGAQKAEKWAFWPFLRDFESVRAPNRCSGTPRSMIGYLESTGAHNQDFCTLQVYSISV